MTKTSEGQQPVSHTFVYRGPNSRQIRLVGSFNGWDCEATPMRKQANGMWTVTLQLVAGRYEYKFIVDGAWLREPACEESDRGCPHGVPNDFGTMNCVLNLPG